MDLSKASQESAGMSAYKTRQTISIEHSVVHLTSHLLVLLQEQRLEQCGCMLPGAATLKAHTPWDTLPEVLWEYIEIGTISLAPA
eukprot:1161312-Pelagomonas_calceolata.AAC.2